MDRWQRRQIPCRLSDTFLLNHPYCPLDFTLRELDDKRLMKMTSLSLSDDSNVRYESTDHGKSVLEGLQHLRQMQQLFDVILVAESQEFPAHRVVLASCSDYFRAMFTDGLRECTEPKINLNGLTASSMSHLLDFAYNSTINIDSDNVYDVLAGASHVQILPVIAACEKYLKDHLTLETCVTTAKVAELFSLKYLQQHALNFICKNWQDFTRRTNEFLRHPPEFLITLLSSGYPVECNELEVLMSVLGWLMHKPTDRMAHASRLFDCIVFENIRTNDFSQILHTKTWLSMTQACPELQEFVPTLEKRIYTDTDEDKIVSVTNYSPTIKSSVSVTRIEVKQPPCKSKVVVPGLVNARGYHSAIIVAGGFRKEAGMTNNVMYLDRGSGSFKHLTKIPHLDQINFGMTVFFNQLFIVGGCFNDNMQEIAHPFGFRYDPALDDWVGIAPMKEERCRFLLCATEDKLYAIGGDPYAADVGPEDICLAEVYDPRKNEWNYITSLPGNRSQLAGTSFGTNLLVSGGIQENEEKVFQDFYQYVPHTRRWIKKADLLTPRTDHFMFMWEGKVYVIGGWRLDHVTMRRVMATSIDRYDFATDSWEVIGSLNGARTYGTYTLEKDTIYAIGGWYDENQAQKYYNIDTFDLRTQTWTQGREQTVAMWEHGACSLYLPKFPPAPPHLKSK